MRGSEGLSGTTRVSSLGCDFRAGTLKLISGTQREEHSRNLLSSVEGGSSLLTEARAILRPILVALVASRVIVSCVQKPCFQGPVLGPQTGGPNQGKKSAPAVRLCFSMFMRVGDDSQ